MARQPESLPSLNKMRRLLTISIGIWLLLVGCSSQHSKEKVVAEIGDRKITEAQFLQDYTFAPSSIKTGTVQEIKQRFLDGMIEEMLFAIDGEKHGFTQDSAVQKLLTYHENREIIRELYRREVRQQVHIPDTEVANSFEKLAYEIHARHLFARDKATADSLKNLLDNGATFYELARNVFSDPKLANSGGDLGTVKWGELDADLENAIFSLPVGQISDPIQSKYGYHIVKVDSRVKNVMQTVGDYTDRAQTVKTILRRRKEHTLAHQYIQQVMAPQNVRMKGPVFGHLVDMFWNHYSVMGDSLKGLVQDPELDLVESQMKQFLGETLVTSRHNTWTVRDVLEMYRYNPMSFSIASERHCAVSLENIIGILTRDAYLSQLGREKGLAKAPRVRQFVENRRDEILARRMKRAILDTVTVSDFQATAYFNRHRDLLKSEFDIADDHLRYHQLPLDLQRKIEDRAKNFYGKDALRDELNRIKAQTDVTVNQELLNTIQLPDANEPRKIDIVATWLQ